MVEGKIQQAQDSSDRLSRLYELALTVAGDPIEVFDQIVSIIADLFKVRVALVEKLEDDRIITLSMYMDGRILHEGVFELGGTPCAKVREAKTLCAFNNASDRFPQDEFLKTHGFDSYVGAPVISSSGEVIAIVNAMNDSPFYLTDNDRLFLAALASRIRLELEREEQLSEARVVRALLNISKEISVLRPLEETLQLVAERAKEVLGTDIVAVATTDGPKGMSRWKAVAGAFTDAFKRTTFAPGKGTAARTISARETIILNDVGLDPGLSFDEFPIHKAEGIRNTIGVPLFHGDEIAGVLMAGYRSGATFTARKIALAEALAGQAAVAIDNARLFGELERANKRLLDADQLKTEMIAELSTPVIPIRDRVLLAPIIGTLTLDRTRKLTEAVLEWTAGGKPEVIILDITGMRLIDSDAAQHLRNTVASARVLGADCIITGIGAAVAQTLVRLGVTFEGIETRRRLSDGLRLALELQERRR